MLAVLLLPVGATALLANVRWLPIAAWSSGAGDAAFVGFLAVSAFLLLHWRLIGDAPSAPFAAAAAVAGLYVVPTTAHLPPAGPGYAGALRAVAVAVIVVLCVYALALPEVRAAVWPAGLLLSTIGAVPVLALAVAASPLGALTAVHHDGVSVFGAAEAAACAAVASALLLEGARRRQALFVAAGTAALSVGVACAASSVGPLTTSRWAPLPSIVLLTGAAARLVWASAGAKAAVRQVVLEDLRGRRRWEAAEGELERARHAYQGQRHDINSMLSALDGTLLVLTQQRDLLRTADVDRLLVAVRHQLQALRATLSGSSARPYDLSLLLANILAVRANGPGQVVSEVQAGLQVEGHPERVTAIVDNLLANASVHAPGACITVHARRLRQSGREVVEIVVSDQGPGLPDRQLELAFERGWRGKGKEGIPGSGLGLSQCRELAQAEGGSISLGPTEAFGPPGRRGLTARLLLPVRHHQVTEHVLPPPAGPTSATTGRIVNFVEGADPVAVYKSQP
jgi:signal transduction histidine kinase